MLFLSPAEALTSSAALRRGASALLQVVRAEGGSERFARLVDEAVAQLESSEEDLDALLRAGEPRGAEGPSHSEAREALRGALRLLDIGSQCEQEVEVTSRSGFTFNGVMSGERVHFDLERRDARSSWGTYSPFAIVSGPLPLLGMRVVEVDSNDDSDSPADDPFSGVTAGDKLYLADPDRAAVKEVLLYDHLPEMSRWITPLLELASQAENGEAEGVATVDGKVVALSDLYFEEELLDAVRFCLLTEQMETEDSRVQARMRRLADFPALQDLRKLVAADPDWQELSDALQPRCQALYGAARAASLRSRSLNADGENRVDILSVDGERVQAALAVFALVVVVAVGVFLAKLGDSSSITGAQGPLPLYGLQPGTEPRTVPLLYGTPLMPSQ